METDSFMENNWVVIDSSHAQVTALDLNVPYITMGSHPTNGKCYATICWEDTHFRQNCSNNPKCKVCKEEGHSPGSEQCKANTQTNDNITVFNGADNPLSNFYQSEIKVFGVSHASAEHAFQYVKAMRSGDLVRVQAIQAAPSALDAKENWKNGSSVRRLSRSQGVSYDRNSRGQIHTSARIQRRD